LLELRNIDSINCLKLSQVWQNGGMSSETPERLKWAVEELLLAKGEAGITLRDITDAAEANVAAVAYHFKSKDNLVSLVFSSAIEEVTRLQVARVESLPKNHTLRQLIEVWLHPLIGASGPNDREAKLWRIIQRGAAEKSPGLLASMAKASNPAEKTLMPLLASHLSHLDKDELLFRHNAIMGGLAGMVSGPIGQALAKDSASSKSREFMIAWIIGSLKGPAAKK
jgi:AcrR family transcriptional regulator